MKNVYSYVKHRTQSGDKKNPTENGNTLFTICLVVSQLTETVRQRGKRELQQKRRVVQFRQSCVDNFPGADLVRGAVSPEFRRQPLGCLGPLWLWCAAINPFFKKKRKKKKCRQRNLVLLTVKIATWILGAPQLRHCDGYWRKKKKKKKTLHRSILLYCSKETDVDKNTPNHINAHSLPFPISPPPPLTRSQDLWSTNQ